MNEEIAQALARDRTIDITTTGRKTGLPRRIEIWYHIVEGRYYITGTPGRARSWYANLRATPDFVFHLKESIQCDLPATARPISDEMERRQILAPIVQKLDHSEDLDAWVTGSPLVEVVLHPEEKP